MGSKWIKTSYSGIETRQHENRKHGVKFDVYYRGRFMVNGKSHTVGFGWSSEGWTLKNVFTKLQELKHNAKTGQGAATLKEEQRRREVEEKRKREEHDRAKKENVTLQKYFNQSYYPVIQETKKRRTHKAEEQLFRIWIKPVLGNKTFKSCSVFDIERLKKKMSDAGRAPRSIEYCLTVLGMIFRHAIMTGHYTGTIPTTMVKKPKFDNKRVRFLSTDEAHQLLEILKPMSQQVYEMSLLSLHCGLRAGEVFALTWGTVDLEHGLITLLDTKSGKTRALSMTDEVKKMLSEKVPGKRNELVFPAKVGGKIITMSKSFPRAVEKAGFNDGVIDRRQRVTFHTLRHTFASWLVMEGTSLYEVKELLGHASLIMTERYSHLSPDRNKRAAETLGAIFQKTTPAPAKVVNIR